MRRTDEGSSALREADLDLISRQIEREMRSASPLSSQDSSRGSPRMFGFASDNRLESSKFDLFEKSPDYKAHEKHFEDFSRAFSQTSTVSSVEFGMGKPHNETYTNPLHPYTRPHVSDEELSRRLHSSSSLSDNDDFRASGRTPGRTSGRTLERLSASKADTSRLESTRFGYKSVFPSNARRGVEYTSTPMQTAKALEREDSYNIPTPPDFSSLCTLNEHRGSTNLNKAIHKVIAAIPVSARSEAVIDGLHSVQSKLSALELQEGIARRRIQDLEKELARMRQLYNNAEKRSMLAAEEAQRARDSGVGSDVDNNEEKERQRLEKAYERVKHQDTVALLESKIDSLEKEAREYKTILDKLIESRESALKQLYQAREENKELQCRLDEHVRREQQMTLEIERLQFELQNVSAPKAVASPAPDLNKETASKPYSAPEATSGCDSARPVATGLPILNFEERERFISDLAKEISGRNAPGNEKLTKEKPKSKSKSKSKHISEVEEETSEGEFNKESTSEGENGSDSSSLHLRIKTKRPVRSLMYPPKGQKRSRNIARPPSCFICTGKQWNRKANRLRMPRPLSPDFDEGETLRPSQPPEQAIAKVIQMMKGEIKDLKQNYREQYSAWEGLQAGYKQGERKQLSERLKHDMEQIEAKLDQIYALYDVVEAGPLKNVAPHPPKARQWINI